MTTERRTAAELLAQELALTLGQAAIVLNLRHTRGACKGEPDKRQVLALVDAGALRPIDHRQPVGRMTVSANELRRHLGIATEPNPMGATALQLVKDIAS